MRSKDITRTEYRIVARKVGEEDWRYLNFTGATHQDRARIEQRIARCKIESPGWEFKAQVRRVKITYTTWLDAPWTEGAQA